MALFDWSLLRQRQAMFGNDSDSWGAKHQSIIQNIIAAQTFNEYTDSLCRTLLGTGTDKTLTDEGKTYEWVKGKLEEVKE